MMQFEYRLKSNGKRQNNLWLTSLADLLALMLAFFVLLFSMNEVKDDSWQDILETLGIRLNTATEENSEAPSREKNIELFTEMRAFELHYLEKILADKVSDNKDLAGIDVFRTADRLVLSFDGDTYFAPGSDNASRSLQRAVGMLGESLRYVENRIEIYGHTDPQPVTNPDSPVINNWGLSLARALYVGNSLKNAGYSQPLRVYGMADSRFHELDNVADAQKRFSLARRVDIVVREANWQGQPQ
jgi:chemotaxis protein MotB